MLCTATDNVKTEISITLFAKPDCTLMVRILFLRHDIVTSEWKRVIIFASDTFLNAINTPTVSIIYTDGTFKTTPPQFELPRSLNSPDWWCQSSCLLCPLGEQNRKSYCEVWRFLRDRCPHLNTPTCIMDFEKAEHNALQEVFPNSTIRCCLFHFWQAQQLRF